MASSATRKTILSSISVIVLLAILVGIIETRSHGSTPTAATTTTSGSTTAKATTTTSSTETFNDGTYTGTGSYDSPGGEESIKITVTLKDDIITATSAVSGSNDFQSRSYQESFISAYKSLVIGKRITNVQLSKVSGSSLTSDGFNEAITSIENQAKS